MGLKTSFTQSAFAKYVHAIKTSPRPLIFNHRLLLTTALYAMSGLPLTWDQGSSSVIPSLPGFQKAFGMSSARTPAEVSNFICFVYITAAVGSGLSFFINDRIGRLWSLRLYMAIWILGQVIATCSFGHRGALYTARFVSGLGIGPLTVTGPMSIVEIAPTEIRGLLSVWFSVVMLVGLTVSVFAVYGSLLHIAASHLQYQVVFFAPTIAVALTIVASFFMYESPRWLMLKGREEKAIETLVALRGLPADHPRVATEIYEIRDQIEKERHMYVDGEKGSMVAVMKEAFLVPANLRRIQQAVLAFALAQLSGANAVTGYLVSILKLMGVGGGADHSMFITGMYSMAKLFYTMMASFFFVDALGRRKSLFVGITIQMLSDIYMGVYIKYKQAGPVSEGASQGAIAAIFLHGFGYAVGLLVLPYVFGAELWPNNIRSFGAALSQMIHWFFSFGITKGMPSILSSMNNWGAFLFFAGWCFVALLYSAIAVPETANLSLEETDALFEGPFWQMTSKASKARKARRSNDVEVIDSTAEMEDAGLSDDMTTAKGFGPAKGL